MPKTSLIEKSIHLLAVAMLVGVLFVSQGSSLPIPIELEYGDYVLLCNYSDLSPTFLSRIAAGKISILVPSMAHWRADNTLIYEGSSSEMDNFINQVKQANPDAKIIPCVWAQNPYTEIPDLSTSALRQKCVNEVVKFLNYKPWDGIFDDTERWVGTHTNHFHYFSACAAAVEATGKIYYPWLWWRDLDYVKSQRDAVGAYGSHAFPEATWKQAIDFCQEHANVECWWTMMVEHSLNYPTLSQQLTFLNQKSAEKGSGYYSKLTVGLYRYRSMTDEDWTVWINWVNKSATTARATTESEPEPPVFSNNTNLLGNPSMEIDRDTNGMPDGWNFYKTPNMLATHSWSSDSHTGTHSIKITSTYNPSTAQTESALWYQQISKIDAGETYRFKVWYQSNIQSTILLLTYSRSSIIEAKFLDLPPSTLWKQSGWLTTTIPSGAASLRVDCRLFNKDTGWAIFDDLELVSSTPPEPEPPEPEPEPLTPEANLVLNPSVELGNGQPDYWGFYKTPKMIATGSWVSDAHTGSKAVRIEATYNPNGKQTESALWCQTVQNYIEGETYKFRVWYKCNTPATIIMFARIGSTLATISILTLPPSSVWVQSGWVSITVPKGSTFVQTDVRLMNKATGWAVFDDFELVTV